MKRTLIALICGAGIILAFAAPASADPITLSFNPVNQSVNPGSPLFVALTISGLGAFTSPSLGVYDLDVLFDPSILSLTNVTFGDPVLGSQLDLFGLGNIAQATSGTGFVNLFELSFDLPTDLDSLQPDSFILAILHFNALGSGTSPLTINVNAIGDSLGTPLAAQVQQGSVTVVPEPGTVALFSAGLAASGVVRRRRGANAGTGERKCG